MSGFIPWSPLARGFLAGNRNAESRGETVRAKTDEFAQRLYYRPSDFTVVERLTEIANKARESRMRRVALAWILAKPGVSSPIIGASKMAAPGSGDRGAQYPLDESEIKAWRSLTSPTFDPVSGDIV